MKVLILGCGVIGTTTAWHLLREGHEVTVLDREPPAQGGASFGNAGLIAPGHSFAWGGILSILEFSMMWNSDPVSSSA